MNTHDETLDYSDYRFRDYWRYSYSAWGIAVVGLSVAFHLHNQSILSRLSLAVGIWAPVALTLWRMRRDMREDMA